MGAPYQNQTASGYSSSPPPDDGSVTAANKIKYATIKGQIGDPLKVYVDAVNSALRTALNVTPTSQSSAYTTTTADHQRPIEVTGTTTISLGDAATMVAASMGYSVPIINTGIATVTVSRITAGNTLNGAAKDIKLAPGQAVICTVNSTNNGYNVKAVSNGVLFDPTDPSKQARFDVSGVTAGNTRVITMPDYAVTLGNIPAGVVMDYAGSGVPTGWLECDGSAVSRTTYAALFTAVGTTYGAGDGSTTFNLPPSAGRVRIGRGTGTVTETITSQTASGNAVPVASNNTKWITGMQVTVSNASGFTGLTNGTWFIVRASATTVQFATSLANAQNGTVATVTGTGSATLTAIFTARAIGETGGEEAHAMSSAELLSHTHNIGGAIFYTPVAGGSGFTGGTQNISSAALPNFGGNVAMNNMQPYVAMMTIIKY